MPVDYLVSDAPTQGAGTCSSSPAVRFGSEGVMGLQNGELPVGDPETEDSRASTTWAPSSA